MGGAGTGLSGTGLSGTGLDGTGRYGTGLDGGNGTARRAFWGHVFCGHVFCGLTIYGKPIRKKPHGGLGTVCCVVVVRWLDAVPAFGPEHFSFEIALATARAVVSSEGLCVASGNGCAKTAPLFMCAVTRRGKRAVNFENMYSQR